MRCVVVVWVGDVATPVHGGLCQLFACSRVGGRVEGWRGRGFCCPATTGPPFPSSVVPSQALITVSAALVLPPPYLHCRGQVLVTEGEIALAKARIASLRRQLQENTAHVLELEAGHGRLVTRRLEATQASAAAKERLGVCPPTHREPVGGGLATPVVWEPEGLTCWEGCM